MSFLFSTSVLAETVPDLTIQIGQHQSNWLLQFQAPAKHHFNLKAPMKVTAEGLAFSQVNTREHVLSYQASVSKLKEGALIQASVFLCDDALTYCINKTQKFALKVNSDLQSLKQNKDDLNPKKTKAPSANDSNTQPKKDSFGFWDNRIEDALQDSRDHQKPLLIDFYGIWCPPCNFYEEQVFHTKEFKKLTKAWVLLKVDADREWSFELKSKFKIGGYPTLVFIKSPKKQVALNSASLEEIERVIGFFPIDDFSRRLKFAYASKNFTLEERLAAARDDETKLEVLLKLIEVSLEKHETEALDRYIRQGLQIDRKNNAFLIEELALKSTSVLKSKASLALLESIHQNRAHETSRTLLRLTDLMLSDHPEVFSDSQLIWVKDALNELEARVNPKTLSVDGLECSIGDLASARADLALTTHADTDTLKKAYANAAIAYQKLIDASHEKDSRGLNIEYAHYLGKSGDFEKAKAVYARFVKLYPKEFTFYFGGARFFLDAKALTDARAYAEKAFVFSYGDNQLRVLELLLKIMNDQGEKEQALARCKAYLEAHPEPVLANVRTHRYLEAIKKQVSELEPKKV